MALITDASEAWSDPITLANDELWQARWGSTFISTTGTPAANDGFALTAGQGIVIRAGLQVRYRKEGTTDALIVREVV